MCGINYFHMLIIDETTISNIAADNIVPGNNIFISLPNSINWSIMLRISYLAVNKLITDKTQTFSLNIKIF